MRSNKLIALLLALAMTIGGPIPRDAHAQSFIARHGVAVAATFGALAVAAVIAGPASPIWKQNVSFLRIGMKIHTLTGAPLIYAALQTLVLSDAFFLIGSRALATEIGLDASRIKQSKPNMVIYRVWGGGSGQYGPSWTPVDPRTLGSSYRNIAGLPVENDGTHLSQAVVVDDTGIIYRAALPIPLAGTAGGLPEIYVPNAQFQLQILPTEVFAPPS